MVVLDTTFIIHFLRNGKNAVEKSRSLPGPVCTTRINVFEVLIGIYSQKAERQGVALETFNAFLGSLNVLELDATSADEAARISAELNKKGQTVHASDILIAAIALANKEDAILTQNVKDFSRIGALKVETY